MKSIKCLSAVLLCCVFASCDPYFWMGMMAGMMSMPTYNTYNTYPSYTPTYVPTYTPTIDWSTMPIGTDASVGTSVSSSPSGSTTRTKKLCGACDGKGWIPSTRGVASFGQEKWCSECGKKVPSSHYHETCPSCKGEGKW